MIKKNTILWILLFAVYTISAQNNYEWKTETSNGYEYKYVNNDPYKARFYTLENGLTVILAENHQSPRVSFHMAVRSGSNNDPREHTGLAHYLEHMLFKGTDKYGSLDWEKEKPLIDKIENLYETYKATKDKEERRKIYAEIDRVSGEAAKYAIAGEYDQMMSSIGSQGTNAWTWLEQTVYTEEIPSNAIDKFLVVQAERFRSPVLRLFHTELEAVYEEKNGSYLNDGFTVGEVANDALFPTHNYGQQTTIGTIEHLKSPSLKAIKEYYQDNYIPNNMGVIMVGDINPDELIVKIDAAFAYMKSKKKNEYIGPKEDPINGPIVKELTTPTAKGVHLFWRTNGAHSKEALMAELASSILSNNTAGLIDLNLIMDQMVQGAFVYPTFYKDYGILQISGTPQEGQTLEEVKDLLLGQIELLKQGQFDESLITAIVANRKLNEQRGAEYSEAQIASLTEEFIKSHGEKWNINIGKLDKMAKISKKELVAFANTFFTPTNYVVVYKHEGEDSDWAQVEKPPITPVETNAGKSSDFVNTIVNKPNATLKPVWMDFEKDITKDKLGVADVLYVKNSKNSLFELSYIFPFGKWTDNTLPAATTYLNFLGTDKKQADEIVEAFYNLACSFYVNVDNKETTITISGLQENFEEAVALFEKLLNECAPNEDALFGLKEMLKTQRADNKIDKGQISNALNNYAVYGSKNPFNYVLSDKEIEELDAKSLVNSLHELGKYKHTISYYGPSSLTEVKSKLDKIHELPKQWKAERAMVINLKPIEQKENVVLFVDFDNVQADLNWVRVLDEYQPENEPIANALTNYFGGGMGSVVFSTIRESKALAYGTGSYIFPPSEKGRPFQLISFIGTQADKLDEAMEAMNELHNNLPESKLKFESTIGGLKNAIETERIRPNEYISRYLRAQKKGLNYDIRKMNYAKYDEITFKDIEAFHQKSYANKPYTHFVIASKKLIDFEGLKKYGKVKELTLEEIFGY